jgi:hypothetical protein
LTRALELREGLGDHAGAAVTRHNLDLLSGPPPPDDPPPRPRPRLPLAAGAAILAVAAGAALAVAASGGGRPAAATIPTTTASTTSTASKTTTPRTTTHTATTTSTATTQPPAAALQVTPDPVSIQVQDFSGAVRGAATFTAKNTSSSTVSIVGVVYNDPEYSGGLDGCQNQPIPSGQTCPGAVTLHATAPSGPPTKLTFVLKGAAPVTVGVTICLSGPTASAGAGAVAPSTTTSSNPSSGIRVLTVTLPSTTTQTTTTQTTTTQSTSTTNPLIGILRCG